MVIGVDFDNTLVSYDDLFERLARERGLTTGPGKKAIRDQIRQLPNGEIEWQKLQGIAYGPRMSEAKLIEGVPEFFAACQQRDIPVHVISHKTEFAGYDDTRTNLRQAALAWMKANGLPDAHFGNTRAEKLATIKQLGCTVFVDDLEETFLEPDFPAGVEKILFAPHGHAPVPGVHICRSWQEISDRVFFTRLLDRPVGTMEWIGGGGNSRIYKLDGPVAGKVYFQQKRLDIEFAALQFMWKSGIRCVPQPIAADEKIAIYEFIEGSKPVPTEADIDAAADFLFRLKGLTGDFPPAAEACFSVREIIANIESRFARLAGTPVVAEFQPLLDRVRQTLDSPTEERMLSPSDFGFHNALRRPDGSLVFLDFEYFGWDDPAKLVCDFLLHPAMDLSDELKRRFYRRFVTNKNLAKRVETVYPLFGLKWITIMLNEFLPEDLQRRGFAAGQALDRAAAQARQLEKARRMLARIEREYESFPYRD
jgi:thiamine kinase-like enzyme